jgi:hypothetical protein
LQLNLFSFSDRLNFYINVNKDFPSISEYDYYMMTNNYRINIKRDKNDKLYILVTKNGTERVSFRFWVNERMRVVSLRWN